MISIVTAYQSRVEMTREFLANLDRSRENRPVEVVLVNAGCPVLLEHPILTRRIDLLRNISFSHSMNTGIKAATGDYVVVMNNDVFPEPGWLSTLVDIARRTRAYIISPEASSPALSSMPDCFILKRYGDYAEVSMYPAVCWMLTRVCLDTVGLFDEQFIPTMFEDNDYARRVLDAGGLFVVATVCKVHHRRSVENHANHADLNAVYAENERRFKQKWGDA